MGLGVAGYPVKPFRRDQLNPNIERAFKTSRALRRATERKPLELEDIDGDVLEGTVISSE
jgi:hypothetical protein